MSSVATFVPVTSAMIDHVASHMRPEDIAEGTILHGGGHFNRSASIRTGVQASKGLSWCILDRHGEPIATLGAGPTPHAEVGQVWMVGTPKLHHHGKTLVVGGKLYMAKMHEFYPVLTNLVMASNTRAIRWLSRLGCYFVNSQFISPARVEFLQFVSTQINVLPHDNYGCVEHGSSRLTGA